jgi:hypothetical protein
MQLMEMDNKLAPTLQDYIYQLSQINIGILKGRLERGNILIKLKESKAYVGYDSYCDTWDSFLEAINISRETARQDMDIFKEFAFHLYEQRNLNVRYERLVRLLPIVKKEPQMKQGLVEMATISNRADFDNNLRELKGKIPTDSCGRCFERVQKFEKCIYCGKFRIIEDI